MTNEWKYEINDLVWAKMKGFPPWPGRVSEPTVELSKKPKKNCKCIFFYGTNNYAWIELGCLKPYYQFKDTLTYSCKTVHFKDAVKAIEQYILETNDVGANNGISEADSRFENLVNNESPSFQPERSKIVMSTSTPNPKKAKKRTSKPVESTSNGPKKNKRKKPRLNSNRETDIEEVEETPNHDNNVLMNLGLRNATPLRKNTTLIDRPQVKSPKVEIIDMTKVSKDVTKRKIIASKLRFGFIGLGNMGSGIVKNLLHSGHHVTVWNRTPSKSKIFEEAGATVGLTPSDVIGGADITFSCVSDPQVAKDMVFGNCGVLPEICTNKGFVEMTGIDPETSQDICDAIVGKGGRYLEAMIQGNKADAENGNLVCITAGDDTLFRDCKTAFNAMSSSFLFLGDVGEATKMNLILHSIKAVSLAGLAECMALASRANISQNSMLELINLTSLKCPLIEEKGQAMLENNFETNQALKHIQKDLGLCLSWSDFLEQPCPILANVNEVFKHAKRLGYSEHDTSSVYVRAKF